MLTSDGYVKTSAGCDIAAVVDLVTTRGPFVRVDIRSVTTAEPQWIVLNLQPQEATKLANQLLDAGYGVKPTKQVLDAAMAASKENNP